MNKLAKLDFYNKEITKIQQELFDKLDNVVAGLSRLSDTELLQLAQQIDFFTEMETLGYTALLGRVSSTYDDEIATIFAELSNRQLSQVSAASVDVLRQLKDFELTYLSNQVKQYSDQLKVAMLRGLITGQSTSQILSSLNATYGVGNIISSSESAFLIEDAFSRFSQTVTGKVYEEFPETRFQYEGTIDSKTRQVCRRAIAQSGQGLTRAEIDKLGYVNFTDRGGYNCRHRWVKALVPFTKEQLQARKALNEN